jgi:hypothetical protein
VNRLVETSQGWLLLDFSYQDVPRLRQETARAIRFDERGWARSEDFWAERLSDESLAAFISRVASIPGPEAAALAEESLREWRASPQHGALRWEQRQVIAIVLVIAALLVVGIAAVILLALMWFS